MGSAAPALRANGSWRPSATLWGTDNEVLAEVPLPDPDYT
jgi:hypothetical protein